MKLTVAPAPHLRGAGLVITIASLAAIAFATLSPEPPADVGSIFCLVCGSVGGVSAILNVFLFVPLGLGLALSGLPAKRALLGMFALSVLIETAQFFVIPGRDATIGDVLTNTLGGALGFVIGRYAPTLLRPPRRAALALAFGWSAVWLAIQTISAFGFSPSIPSSEYYGQITRRVGNLEQFRGTVVQANIADVTVPDTRFSDSHRAQELLLRGAVVTATVVPAEVTRQIAPIVRVADTHEREIILLAQNVGDLVFGIRTGATALRLRAPFFALPQAFSALSMSHGGLTTDTLLVRARYSAREVWLTARGRTIYYRRIPIFASLGWTMLLPFQWFIEGTRTELVVSAFWIGFLLLPIGYWCGAFVKPGGSEIRMVAAPIALMVLVGGLVVVPRAFGVTPASPGDWLAGFIGIFSGAALAPHSIVSS